MSQKPHWEDSYRGSGAANTFGGPFTLIGSFRETHQTPWGKPQAFVRCLFRRVRTPEAAEGRRR